MKKLFTLIIMTLIISACKKESVTPIVPPPISKDSIEAAKLNISVSDYLEIKSILNELSDNQIKENSNVNAISDF